MEGFPRAAQPVLTNVGGGRRVLALAPEGSLDDQWTQRPAEKFGDCCTISKTDGGWLTMYCEVSGLAS